MSKHSTTILLRSLIVLGLLGLPACKGAGGLLGDALSPLTTGSPDASGIAGLTNSADTNATTTSSSDSSTLEDSFDSDTNLQQDSQPVSIYVPIAKENGEETISETPDTLLMTVAVNSVSPSADARQTFWLSLPVAVADDTSSQEIVIQGQAGAANPDYDITFKDEDAGTDLTQLTPNSDGSFSVTLDDSLVDRKIAIAYVDVDTGDISASLELTVYSNGNFHFELPTDSSASTRYTVSGKYMVIASQADAQSNFTYSITSLDGTSSEVLAESDERVLGLAYFPGTVSGDYLLGLVGNTKVARLDSDGLQILSDYNDGDTLPDGSKLDQASVATAVRPSGDTILVQGFSSAKKALEPKLVPADPDLPDQLIPIADESQETLLGREMIWRDSNHVVVFSEYEKSTQGQAGVNPKAKKQSQFSAELLDMSSFFAEPGIGQAVPQATAQTLFTTPFAIESPSVSPLDSSEPFFVFTCRVEGVKQICLSHYDGNFEVLTTGSENKTKPVVSAQGLFVAYEQFDADDNAQIMVRYLPTGDTFSLTSGSAETVAAQKTTFRRPQFTQGGDNKFVLAFMGGNSSVGFKPTIINLAMHPTAGRYISGSPYYDVGDDGSE